MRIATEDLTRLDVQALLREHLLDMHENSPPGCVRALDLSGLKAASVTFWTVRAAGEWGALMGCGALKELSTPASKAKSGEIKSMRTATTHLRKGVATQLLARILKEAKRRQYERVSLETGSSAAFEPAKRLYEKFGFIPCGPFGDYQDNNFNLFMTLEL